MRDLQRAKQFRAKGELKPAATLLEENVVENVFSTSIDSFADAARGSRAATGTNHVTVSSVTFDPSSAPVCSETHLPSAPAVPMQEPLRIPTQFPLRSTLPICRRYKPRKTSLAKN